MKKENGQTDLKEWQGKGKLKNRMMNNELECLAPLTLQNST
jgi:hypothetical protein